VKQPSVTRTGLPSARPVPLLPIAKLNIAATVTAVQVMPRVKAAGTSSRGSACH
jgi:hypothetical protein